MITVSYTELGLLFTFCVSIFTIWKANTEKAERIQEATKDLESRIKVLEVMQQLKEKEKLK